MFFLSNNNPKEIQVLNSEKIKTVDLLNRCDNVVLFLIKKKKCNGCNHVYSIL